jgi:hypothetical protein
MEAHQDIYKYLSPFLAVGVFYIVLNQKIK